MKKIWLWAALGLIIINRKKIMEIALPVLGRISSKFGDRIHPVTNQKSFHNGIDIAVPVGTAVKSPMDGKVLVVNNTTAGGNQIIIKHTNGYKTGYAHLSKVVLNVGDLVNAGDVIALSGDTGTSSGPHLHFTLTDPQGNKVNPELYIKNALA